MKYFLSILFFLTANLFSQTIHLDLKKSISMSLEESEDFKIQKNEILKSEYKTKETTSILFPQISGEVFYINNIDFPEIPTTKFIRKVDFNAGVNINQIITTFGKISSAINAMKKFSSMNKYREDSVKDEVIFNTKLLYYNAYFNKKILEIMKESYDNTLKNKELLERRSETGRLSNRDNIKVSADIAARIPMVSNAESSFITALESLKRTIGVSNDDSIELIEGYPSNYEDFNFSQVLTNLHEKQPVLKALAQSIEAQKYLIKSKKAEYFPTLSAFYKNNYKGSSNDYYVGNNVVFNYSSVGLNLQIPLFYGFRTSYKVKQSVADRDNAVLTYQKTKKNLELELQKAFTEYNEIIKTLPANQEALSLAKDSFKITQDLFESGQLDVTDVNDAELMLTNQKIKSETSLFKLQIALAKIQRLSCLGNTYE